MRAVVLGLVGAVLAAGGAQAAAKCPITQATVQVQDTGFHYGGIPVERADLVGRRFRVVRFTHNPRIVTLNNGDRRQLGYDAALLRPVSGSGDLIYVEEKVVGSPPMWAASWPVDKPLDPKRSIEWKKSKPRIAVVGEEAFYGNIGPLSSLSLKTISCR